MKYMFFLFLLFPILLLGQPPKEAPAVSVKLTAQKFYLNDLIRNPNTPDDLRILYRNSLMWVTYKIVRHKEGKWILVENEEDSEYVWQSAPVSCEGFEDWKVEFFIDLDKD